MENNKLPFLILLPEGQVKRYNFVITIPQHNLPAYYRKINLIYNSNNLHYMFTSSLENFKALKQIEKWGKLKNFFVLFSCKNEYPNTLEETKENLKAFLEKAKISFEEEELTDLRIKFWQIWLKTFYIRVEESQLESFGPALSANRKISMWSDSKPFR